MLSIHISLTQFTFLNRILQLPKTSKSILYICQFFFTNFIVACVKSKSKKKLRHARHNQLLKLYSSFSILSTISCSWQRTRTLFCISNLACSYKIVVVLIFWPLKSSKFSRETFQNNEFWGISTVLTKDLKYYRDTHSFSNTLTPFITSRSRFSKMKVEKVTQTNAVTFFVKQQSAPPETTTN